ncbi:MAG: UdgX family uracil-DNA binding protein [Aquihabitans sp.]
MPPLDAGPLLHLAEDARSCRACPLWEPATQVVFGAGPATARAVLVGEQPGDREDREGEPFVGPAGRVLDEALEEAGVVRAEVYLTNAVKHFKFELRGKRRIHQRPNASERSACRPWLDRELAVVQPELVVLLGATAAQGVLGSAFRVTEHHGVPVDSPLDALTTATIHPSAVLRAGDRREALRRQLVDDLRSSFALLAAP